MSHDDKKCPSCGYVESHDANCPRILCPWERKPNAHPKSAAILNDWLDKEGRNADDIERDLWVPMCKLEDAATSADRPQEGYPGIAHDFETMRSALVQIRDECFNGHAHDIAEAALNAAPPPEPTTRGLSAPEEVAPQSAAAAAPPSSERAHVTAAYPRDNALELARSEEIGVLAWKAGHGNETLTHADQALLARSFLAVAAELEYRDKSANSATLPLETTPYPEPPPHVTNKDDFYTGCTAYRDALKRATTEGAAK